MQASPKSVLGGVWPTFEIRVSMKPSCAQSEFQNLSNEAWPFLSVLMHEEAVASVMILLCGSVVSQANQQGLSNLAWKLTASKPDGESLMLSAVSGISVIIQELEHQGAANAL